MILKQCIFLHHIHEGTFIKSHITEFTFIINKLDKIEVKIEDEDQELILLCFLPSSYKSFRKVIVYGSKQSIKVNEAKEYMFKDKINKLLTCELHCDDSSQVFFAMEKSNNRRSTGKSKYKDLVCNYCHKKGHIRVD